MLTIKIYMQNADLFYFKIRKFSLSGGFQIFQDNCFWKVWPLLTLLGQNGQMSAAHEF
jgi:hypothetical protein